MRIFTLALALSGLFLSGCTGSGESGSFSSGLNDLGSSIGGGFGRDTYGTNRRVDVYGGSTSPSLPSIGTPGLGK